MLGRDHPHYHQQFLRDLIQHRNILFGLNEKESDILKLEEYKRRRGESGKLGLDDTVMGHEHTEPTEHITTEGAIISKVDSTTPIDQIMAELALQSSQLK